MSLYANKRGKHLANTAAVVMQHYMNVKLYIYFIVVTQQEGRRFGSEEVDEA